jgi:hypothetical protein
VYKGFYEEKPLTVLIMPPINRTVSLDAKEYFHSTLNISLANLGYYVIPPFLSMEILKRESAYDSELFLNSNLSKFGDVFGADVAVFTVIHEWKKRGFSVNVEIEYIIKSVKTNEVIYTRKGNVTCDTSAGSGYGGGIGALVSVAASAINTAVTKYIEVARLCNTYTFKDLPKGKYSRYHNLDGEEFAGKKEFKVRLKKSY